MPGNQIAMSATQPFASAYLQQVAEGPGDRCNSSNEYPFANVPITESLTK